MFRTVFTLVLTLGFAAAAHAATEQPRVFAVLEFTGPAAIPPAELALLSDQARAGALRALKPHGFLMVTRESMVTLLREMGRTECAEGECEVDTLRSVHA